MKQLTSYNRVAGYLNKLFDLLNEHYFESGRQDALMKKEYIKGLYDKGLDYDGILEEYKNHFWTPGDEATQPFEAFLENAMNTINVMLKEIEQ